MAGPQCHAEELGLYIETAEINTTLNQLNFNKFLEKNTIHPFSVVYTDQQSRDKEKQMNKNNTKFFFFNTQTQNKV